MSDDDPKKPISGLPPPKPTTDSIEESTFASNLEKARNCPRCSRPGRVVSNNVGVNVHCGPCKIHWPLANSPLRPEIPAALPRGLSKQTSVEPDWSVAYDRDVGDT